MATNADDQLNLYKQVNEELRRFYDYICGAFEQLKNKALALLAGEAAIVTFLFQDFHLKNSGKGLPTFGYVLLGLGIMLLVLAYAAFLHVISKIDWRFPTEEHDMKTPMERFKNSELEFHKYLHAEYMEKIVYCNNKLLKRSGRFMLGVYCLSAGVFFVMLVKYGGGA